MAEVIRVIPEGEPRKKNTLVIHIETEDANKKLDELIEKANQLKATLKECGVTADIEKKRNDISGISVTLGDSDQRQSQ